MKIDFEYETKYGIFRDAIHLPDNHTLSATDIENLKQQRLTNWLQIVEAPPQETPPIEASTPADIVEIAGETYRKLEGVPQSGAKLVEINGVWYYKV